jgi:hypothetical protein
MAKTKIFWIAKKVDDTMQMWAYNNKRKAEEKGLELYGVGITDFSFNLDGEEFEDEDGFTAYISSGQIDSFGHFLLWRADGMPHAIGLEQERAATEYVEAELPSSAGACFPAKLKGGSCDVYMSSAVEANGALWTFEDGEVNEKTKTTMKYVPTFESFVNEYSTIVETTKMLKALKNAVKKADSFEEIGEELEDLDYKKEYQWELVKDGSYPVYVITYLSGTRHGIADPKFWENSADIEETIGDVAIGWILTK